KDVNGRTCTQKATIAQPLPISCSISGLSDVETGSTTNTVTATAGGGTPPYSFEWSCNNSTWTMTGTASDNQSSTLTSSGPGQQNASCFPVKTTDANGCTAVCAVTVSCTPPGTVTGPGLCTFPSPFRLIFTHDPRNAGCYKVTASNPGEFFYNMIYQGTP